MTKTNCPAFEAALDQLAETIDMLDRAADMGADWDETTSCAERKAVVQAKLDRLEALV